MAGLASMSYGVPVFDGISDTISELSDALSNPESMVLDGFEDSDKTSSDDVFSGANMDWEAASSLSDHEIELAHSYVGTELDASREDDTDMDLDESAGEGDDEAPQSALSSFESLPTEVVQNIALRIENDQDLGSLIATSSALYSILHSDEQNCIWRQRFLARYDYPFIESASEFPFAYKMRTFVLQNFDASALEHGLKHKCGHQLDVVKDMILEAYNPSNTHQSPPHYSRNMSLFSEPTSPEWLVKLLACASFGSERSKYGSPNSLFDMIQVTLSHLVLSPRSPVLARIQSSRFNYDLVKVYNYNLPFKTILEVIEREPEEPSQPLRSVMFPNLVSTPATPEPEEPQYKLDMHSLLHIRNFWQRHFAQNIQGVGENTYAAMVRSLSKSGIEPREWDCPLSESIPFNKTWYGHYSCIHPWPKSREELEECQSCAEDWNSIDALLLDLETSTTNDQSMYWPPIFKSISALGNSMPHVAFAKDYNLTYLRGIAPFVEIERSISPTNGSADGLQKWHPFLASRVNGFVHDIPNEALIDEHAQDRRIDDFGDDEDQPIPGWKHICMVVWKPTTQHLLAVLDHAEENYGGASGMQISTDFNTANIWNNQDVDSTNALPAADMPMTQDANTPAIPNSTATANNAGTTTQPTEAEIEAQMKVLLPQRIKSFSEEYTTLRTNQAKQQNTKSSTLKKPSSVSQDEPLLPPLFSAQHIRQLEESFSQAQYLAWDDGTIEYAYTYEGIIIPGGKIMMGRWWRTHGIEGLGPGQEVGVDGVGVEVRPVQSDLDTAATDADVDADGETSDDGRKGKGKSKAKAKAKGKNAGKNKAKKKKRPRRPGKKKANDVDSDEEFVDSEEEVIEEPRVEYEFVTVVNGEESRAVNGCKGLERGPFVFWAA